MSDRAAIIQPGPLSVIGAGIRARLEQAFPPALFVHAWMPARVDTAAWSRLTRRVPLVGIGFNGFSPAAETSPTGISEWSVYLITQNETGDEARLFGDRQAPGLFGMLEVGVAVLHGLNIPDGGSVRVGEATHAFVEGVQDASMAIATIDLSVPTDIDLTGVLRGGDADPGAALTQDIAWAIEAPGVIAGSHTGTP